MDELKDLKTFLLEVEETTAGVTEKILSEYYNNFRGNHKLFHSERTKKQFKKVKEKEQYMLRNKRIIMHRWK